MTTLEIKKYKNLLPRLNINYNECISFLDTQHLFFNDRKDLIVEKKMSLPSFAKHFYDELKQNNAIPSQDCFCNSYIKENFLMNKFSTEIIDGIDARLRRTYPSLVRDIMFNQYVYEYCIDVFNVYNFYLDFKCGIDSLIEKDDMLFGISLFTDTQRSNEFRKPKKDGTRHKEFNNVVMVDFPLDLSTGKKHGDKKGNDILLYDEKTIEEFLKTL